MKIAMSWLREWVDAPAADESARLLTARGLEIEGVTRLGEGLAGVVVAEVRARRPVAGSDHLTLVDVWDGAGVFEVVCGAPNVPAPGGRVAWARPGTSLPGGLAIGVREVRGVRSSGMLCSEQELGLGEGHQGILVLDAGATVGREIATELELRDVVLEVNVTPNRGDCLSHQGVARELAAASGQPMRRPAVDLGAVLGGATLGNGAAATAKVVIEDPEGCARYVARVVDGVTVGPSPTWLRRRLEAVGVRPICNLVDITNYVMFDRGQPLHAFDHAQVAGGTIVVRRARPGERMRTLDGEERALVAGDLLICDAERPVALAGVMGGKDSEVSDATRTVLLESAAFDPRAVRVTARRLGLHSEASQRFERGVDAAGADAASQAACLLFGQLAGGKLCGDVSDVWPRQAAPVEVPLRRARVFAILGLDVPAATVRRQLEAIEVKPLPLRNDEAEPMRFQVPTFRPDLTRECDLIEEIARTIPGGLAEIPATLPLTARAPSAPLGVATERARDVLAAAGLHEIVSMEFVAPGAIAALGFAAGDRRARPRAVANPLRVEQSVMRTSMLPGLLGTLAFNQAQRVGDVGLFEVGTVLLEWDGAGSGGERTPMDEREVAAGVVAGQRAGWLKSEGPVDFFDIKRVVEVLVRGLTGREAGFRAGPAPYLHPGVSAVVSVGGEDVGMVGEVHPRVREALGVSGAVFSFELELDHVPAALPELVRPGRFPGSSRDVSCFLPAELPAARVREAMTAAGGALLVELRVLEDYREPGKVPAGHKSMLWTLTYRSAERTLTDAEVDAAHARVLEALRTGLQATLR